MADEEIFKSKLAYFDFLWGLYRSKGSGGYKLNEDEARLVYLTTRAEIYSKFGVEFEEKPEKIADGRFRERPTVLFEIVMGVKDVPEKWEEEVGAYNNEKFNNRSFKERGS